MASNIILYWDYNNPNNRHDPDILVARGVGNHRRRSFRVWEEGKLPCVLFEVASKNTWREDVGPKYELYARLGIPEYFLFDPEDRYINPAAARVSTEKGRVRADQAGARRESDEQGVGIADGPGRADAAADRIGDR